MNPHDYWLQYLAQNQAQQPQQAPQGIMAPPPQMPPQPQERSPLTSGAEAAINAVNKSKESSFLSDLGGMLGSTLSNISIGRLRTSPVPSARAVGGMMKTLDEQEAIRKKEELDNSVRMLRFLQKQRDYEMKLERQKELDKYRSDNLSEKVRHNLAMESRKGGKEGGRGRESYNTPKLGAKDKASLSAIETARRQLHSINESFSELKDISKGNILSPFRAIPGANKTKQFLAERAGNVFPDLRKENVLRNKLVSKFARLEPLMERIESGKAPGEQLLKRFHDLKVYLSMEQPPEVIEDRIKDLYSELSNTEKGILKSSGIQEIPEESESDTTENVNFSESALKEAERRMSSNDAPAPPKFSPEAMEAAIRRMSDGRK